MRAMVLSSPSSPLVEREIPDPIPGVWPNPRAGPCLRRLPDGFARGGRRAAGA